MLPRPEAFRVSKITQYKLVTLLASIRLRCAALYVLRVCYRFHVQLAEQIEALDLEQQCSDYWLGKADREAAAAGLPPAERAPRHPPRPSGGSARAPTAKRSKRNR